MKVFVIVLVFCLSNTDGISQISTASYCGTGCSRLTIQTTKKTDYCVPNSTVFEITNKLPGKVKVGLWIKKKDGDVVSQGYSEALDQGQSITFHYNVNNVADYCVYYINIPSRETFPSTSDVRKRMNYGYGN